MNEQGDDDDDDDDDEDDDDELLDREGEGREEYGIPVSLPQSLFFKSLCFDGSVLYPGSLSSLMTLKGHVD